EDRADARARARREPDSPQAGLPAPRNEMTMRSVQAAIGAELRVNDRTVGAWMSFAHQLIHDYPTTYEKHSAGRLSHTQTKIIAEEGLIIRENARRELYEQAILKIAPTVSVNRLRPIARRLAEQFTDHSLEQR